MGSAAVKIKLMPDSPDADLKAIEDKASEKIKSQGGRIANIEREPIAFGLNAMKITFTWDEALSTDDLLDKIREIKDVSSAEIIDFRRAIG